jgi:hypothetical protein
MGEQARFNLIGYDGENSGGTDYVQGAPWRKVLTTEGTHTNTIVEAALDQVIFPPNTLRSGSVIQFEALVKTPTTNGTDTLALKVYFGTATLTTAIYSSAATDVADNDIWHVQGTIVIRDADDSGTAMSVVKGSSVPYAEGTVTATRLEETETSSINFETATCYLEIGADWSAASASDIAKLKIFNVSVS